MSNLKRELECSVPDTTKLKLFRYPHKYGGTSWCVGFERHVGMFVSQTFLTEWSEDYAAEKKQFERWRHILGCPVATGAEA